MIASMTAAHKTLPDERELFARMATGDQQAFTNIFYLYTQRIYGFIFSKTKSATLTEEIVQEVFIKVWEKREEINEVSNQEAYIMNMALNKMYDFLRSMAGEEKLKKQVWSSMQSFSNITAETLDMKYSQQLIDEAVEQLSPQRRKVFILSRKEGLTRHEIAERLGVSVNTVDNQLREALIFIKSHIRESGACMMLLSILIRINN